MTPKSATEPRALRFMFYRRLVPLLEFGREREGIDLSKVQLTHHSLKGQGKQPLRLGEVRRPATRVFLYIWRGKLREAGLGAASKGGVSLKAARDKAAEGRTLIKAGVVSISEAGVAHESEGRTRLSLLRARFSRSRGFLSAIFSP